MAGSLIPEPKQQFLNDIGVPLFGGKIYTYAAGTLTPKATYQDRDLTILNTNPVVANARGEVVMYGSGNYRVILKDLFDVTIWDRDNVETPDAPAAALTTSLAASNGASLVGYLPPGATVASTVKAQLDKEFFASNYPSFQAAHDACAAAGGGTLWVDGAFSFTVPFNWDYNKVQICGTHGLISTLNFTALTGTIFAINFINPLATQARKLMSNVRILGPAASTGVSCFHLHSTVTSAISNIIFFGVTIVDFKAQLFFEDQCSNVNWSMCHFTQSPPNFRTTTVIKTGTSVVNTGECLTFSQCQFNNVDTIVENNVGIAGGWQFNQCALVYFRVLFAILRPARITVQGGHIESDTYTASWITTNVNGAMVRMYGVEFWFAGTVTLAPFYSNPNTVTGGIYLDTCDYHADAIGIPYWADQSALGPVFVNEWRAQDSNPRIPFGANPGVQQEPWSTNNANFGNSLTRETGNNATVVLSASQPDTKANTTLISTNAAGQVIFLYKRYPIVTGQNIEGSVRVLATGFAVDSSQFSINFAIYDRNGIQISTGGPFTPANDVTPYTPVHFSWYPLAPTGAAFFEVRIYAQPQNAAGNRLIYLSDMVVNTY